MSRERMLAEANDIERAVCVGGARALVPTLDHVESLSPHIAFALGRAAEASERWTEAALLFRAALKSDDEALLARARAHLGYLHYYDGRFAEGLRLARAAARFGFGLPALEGSLYASVNALAQNRGELAHSLICNAASRVRAVRDPILRAEARLRVARQMVHVLVCRAEYVSAAAESEAAVDASRRLGNAAQHRALLEYLRGYVKAAVGDLIAADHFRAAVELAEPDRGLSRWTRFVWATLMRDYGRTAEAQLLRRASELSVPWEDPLFVLSATGRAVPPPIRASPPDELPFRHTCRGVLAWADGRFDDARHDLQLGATAFGRAGLEHYRRAAMLSLAAALARTRRASTRRILIMETPALIRAGVRRWPWWNAPLAAELAQEAVDAGISPEYWAGFLKIRPSVLAPAEVLRARSLTEAEIRVVLGWLAARGRTRAQLAARLGMSDATVRNHLNRARDKLGLRKVRGAMALRRMIARHRVVVPY